jgi:hypothetical protein
MTDPTLEQVIVERARARSQALIRGDVPALTQILAEDFIYTNALTPAAMCSTGPPICRRM